MSYEKQVSNEIVSEIFNLNDIKQEIKNEVKSDEITGESTKG